MTQTTPTRDEAVPTGWRYSINYGPDGEQNFANVYGADGQFVGNLRTHHAIAICNAFAVCEKLASTPATASGSVAGVDVDDLRKRTERAGPGFHVALSYREMKLILAALAPSPSAPPGHTDLMVTPESIDAFLEANPPPATPDQPTASVEAICKILMDEIRITETGAGPRISSDDIASAARRIASLTPPATQGDGHPDDLAVDRFAVVMKAKLAKKRAEGRGGWEDKGDCSNAFLSQLLREHVGKGDPVDVGNLATMIHQRGERIATPPATPVQPTASVDFDTWWAGRDRSYHEGGRAIAKEAWQLGGVHAEQCMKARASLTPAPTQGGGGEAVMVALEAADAVLTGEDACGLDPIVGSHNPHEHAAGLVREALRVREATRPHPTDPGHWRWRGE